MRPLVLGFSVMAAALLAGCSSADLVPDPAHPLAVDNGAGSEFGNYAARVENEAAGPDGGVCTLYTWDRPLSKDYALRVTSQSCPSAEHPGRMVSAEVSRTLMPLSQSASQVP